MCKKKKNSNKHFHSIDPGYLNQMVHWFHEIPLRSSKNESSYYKNLKPQKEQERPRHERIRKNAKRRRGQGFTADNNEGAGETDPNRCVSRDVLTPRPRI